MRSFQRMTRVLLILAGLCGASGCFIHIDDPFELIVHNNGHETLEVWASFEEDGLDRDWIREIPAHDHAGLTIDPDRLDSAVRVIVTRVSDDVKIFDETYTESDFKDDHDRIDIDVP